jgi:hypothetical protein
MPISIPTKGHDTLLNYSPKEIEAMYLAEGKDPIWSKNQAIIVSREIGLMNKQEQRLWDDVRQHEIPSEKLTLITD